MSQSHHIPHHSLVINDAEKLDHTISLATRMTSQCVCTCITVFPRIEAVSE